MPRARGCAPGPFPLVLINTPLGGSSGRYPEFRSCCYFVSRSCSCLFLSSSSFTLAIRVKERVCVKVVFEGDKFIQVITSLSSFHLLGVFICFYLFVLV